MSLVLDAFSQNQQIVYQRNNWMPYVVQKLNMLRNATGYRARQYVAPSNLECLQLTPKNTIFYQISMPIGSIIYGMYYYSSAVSIQISDDAGRTIWSEPVNSGAFATNNISGGVLRFLTEPFFVTGNGLINTEFHDWGIDVTPGHIFQMLILTAAPIIERPLNCEQGECL